MKKLIDQFLKFGIVGFACFVIDFGIYTFLCDRLGVYYLIAGFWGFVVSVIVNYLLSMKYVFDHRDDLSRIKELFIFVILSVVGLGINELILYIFVDILCTRWIDISNLISRQNINMIAKIIATAIVMIYNFVSRKIILEKRF